MYTITVDIKLFSGFLKTNEKLLNLMVKEIIKECQEGTIFFYRLGNKLYKVAYTIIFYVLLEENSNVHDPKVFIAVWDIFGHQNI